MSYPAEIFQEVKREDANRLGDEIEKDMPIELEPDLGGDRERLHGMPKEYSGWDVYNHEAKKVDTELVNDWTASLNSLLLFAAIFAAVLTAFLVESKKLLELDPSEAMLDVMIFLANNLANGNHTMYSRPKFEPEPYAVTVNCLLFASLSTSLVAALASVVALQWVADYDAAITRGGSSPEDRAKRRQFRYAGVLWWKVGEIIAALPLLLYCSVVLFFSGLVLWMWIVNYSVGTVVAGGMGMAVTFYGVTTALSVVSASAPFRTPLSRSIYSSVCLFFSIVNSLGHLLPIPSSQAWPKERHQRYTTAAVKRDDDEVNRRYWLGMDALVWLASHLSVSQDSYDRLLLLVNELRKEDQIHFTSPGFEEAPWFSIFDLLGWRNLNTVGQDEDISKEEMRAVAILAHCYRIPTIYEIIRPKEWNLYYSDDTDDRYWSQYCDIARTQWSPPSSFTSLNSLFLLLRDIPLPLKDTAKQVEFTIRLSRWRNSPKPMEESPKEEAHRANSPPASSNTSAVVIGRFLKEDDEDLWFIQDDSSLYSATVGRMVRLCVSSSGSMTPLFLDTLRRQFEMILLEDEECRVDVTSCISRPLLYSKSLHRHKAEYASLNDDYASLHGDFTLLLARNLNFFNGVERARRTKEVLTMMWASSSHFYSHAIIDEREGMERFFEANREVLNAWVNYLEFVPHVHEILEHLAHAQGQQGIGSLCRLTRASMTSSYYLYRVISGFNGLVGNGVTPEQHGKLIDFICRDIELDPPGAFRGHITAPLKMVIHHNRALLERFFHPPRDPCLAFLLHLSAGMQVDFANDTGLLKASWTRVAKHILTHHEGTDSSIILKLQASAWHLVPESTGALCTRAYHEPETLAHLRSIFQRPMICHKELHEIGDAHLLLHIFEGILIEFTVDQPELTELFIEWGEVDGLSVVLMLSGGYSEHFSDQMHGYHMDEQCVQQILGMASTITSSQYSLLATLLAIHFGGRSHDLAAFAICVNNALTLPSDDRATSFIHHMASHVQILIRNVSEGSARDRDIATREANKTLNRLHTRLATILVFGRQNSRVLSCARSPGAFSPATGWLAPYMD